MGDIPYPDIEDKEVLAYVDAGKRTIRSSLCPTTVYYLMLECWKEDVLLRPNLLEIVSRLSVLKVSFIMFYLALEWNKGFILSKLVAIHFCHLPCLVFV